jgi:outer membrane receptor protein involved in Fe transport
MRTAAGFANLEFDITRQLTFTAGGRYTDSHIDAALCTSDITGDPLGTGPTLYFVQGRPMASYVTGTCFSYNDLPYTVNGVPPGGAGEYKDTLDEDNVSWRTGLNFKPYDGLLIYGNASKGYKQGGFASISASVFSQYLPVTQESVLAYEAGFKAAFLDGKLEADGAAFYYDYDNKQLRTKINPPLFGIQDALRNIPKSSIRGFELGLSGRPVAPLTFGAAFTYLDAKIDEFTGFIYTDAAGNPIITNFAGTRMPFTSKYQFNLNGNYEANLNSTLKGFIGASVSYRSDTVAAIGGDADPPGLISPYQNIFRIASYTLVDAQFGVKAANDKWTASIFGKNLFDKYYWNNVISANDIIARYTGMPATYGVTFSIRL